jgi:hypothetical protein
MPRKLASDACIFLTDPSLLLARCLLFRLCPTSSPTWGGISVCFVHLSTVFSHHIARRPFVVAIIFALAAAARISLAWKEHVPTLEGPDTLPTARNERPLRDPRVLLLGLIQALFETVMYAFVFVWTGSLDPDPAAPSHPPLGLIFGSFMLALMAGSWLFRVALVAGWAVTRILISALAVAAVSLLVGFATTNQFALLLAFVLFEACTGVYLPAIGTLRANILPDSSRAAAMGWLRVPLNMLVVIFLLSVNWLSHQALFGLCACFCLAAIVTLAALGPKLADVDKAAMPLI